MVSENLIQAIAVTAELTDTDLSEAAARVMAEDLAEYPEEQVLKSLARCRREIKGKLRISEVVSRLDDGRPGAEEAWAMIPKDECGSVVWTAEMSEAYGVAYQLLADGEGIQARMAFIETYRNRVDAARSEKVPVQWIPSLGFDKQSREAALLLAVEKGRITHQYALSLLPPVSVNHQALLVEDKSANPKKVSDHINKLKLIVNKKSAA